MTATRKRHTPQEKIAILRRHLLEKVPVSDLCDQAGIHPTLFYRWQKELFENGQAAFEHSDRQAKAAAQAQADEIQRLNGKLQRKDHVLAELMEEHVRLKKELGEP